MNSARVYSLGRRLAKIEKERGATEADNPFNEILQRVGEPPCATAGHAFVALVRLMQSPDWNERLRVAGFLDDPPPSAEAGRPAFGGGHWSFNQ